MVKVRKRRKKKWHRLLSADTFGGWVWVALGGYLYYRTLDTGCTPFSFFIPCGTPSTVLSISFLVIGGFLVVGRAIVPKRVPDPLPRRSALKAFLKENSKTKSE